MIQGQYLGPKGFEKHLVKRQQKKSIMKRSGILGLMLTPMVDMFSLLVIFLLQSFSTSPEQPTVSGIQLPSASSGASTVDAPVLSLSDKGVYLDAKLIGTLEEVLAKPDPLLIKLGQLRKTWQDSHPSSTDFPGEINVQAHKEIPSTTVSEFLGLLSHEAYGSFQLAVVGGEAK